MRRFTLVDFIDMVYSNALDDVALSRGWQMFATNVVCDVYLSRPSTVNPNFRNGVSMRKGQIERTVAGRYRE